MISAATRLQPSKTTEKIVPVRLIDSAPARASELPAPHSAAPARPASENGGQCSRAIIPGDDPGDQQPPKSTPVPSRLTPVSRPSERNRLANHRSPSNPLGVKGAGEGAIIPMGGLMANAVANALTSLGAMPNQLPLSPARVWHMSSAKQSTRCSG